MNNPAITRVWDRLIWSKKNSDPISLSEEVQLRNEIVRFLAAGWDEGEIFQYMKNMEYFDNITDEDICLSRMNTIYKKVCDRLGKTYTRMT